MKTLSVLNPLSYLICFGIKTIENRTWKTDFRGKILIHSSGSKDFPCIDNNLVDPSLLDEISEKKKLALKYVENKDKYSFGLSRYMDLFLKCEEFYFDKKEYYLKSGYIIGSVELIDIQEGVKGFFAEKNKYNWILENPIIFDNPIKAIGKLGLWDFKEA